MSRKIKKIIWLILILFIIIAFVFYRQTRKPDISYQVIKPEIRDILETVSALGRVKASSEIDLQFETSGKVKQVLVKVGDKVQENDELIKLDDAKVLAQLSEARANLNRAKANKAKVLAGYSEEEIKLSQTAVANAQDNLEKTKESAEKSIEAAQAKVDLARITLENYQQDYQDVLEQNQLNLKEAYEDALISLDSAYLEASQVMNQLIVDFFTNDKLSFSTTNESAKNGAEVGKLKSEQALESLRDILENVDSNSSYEEIDSALNTFKSNLNIIKDFLHQVDLALSDAVGFTYQQTLLDTYKTNLDTAQTNINTALSTIISAYQDIESVKTTNQINLNSAQSAISKAEADLALAEENLESTRAQAQAQIAQAQAALNQAMDELALKQAGPTQADIDLAQAQVEQAQAALALVEKDLESLTLRSPIQGIVTQVNVDVGERVTPGQIVVALIPLGEYQIESNISEVDISRVNLGSSVDIVFDAYPEKVYKGKVISIDPSEEVIQGVVYYKVKIAFEDSYGDEIKPGMTANLDIKFGEKNDVLSIPYRAIKQKNGRYIVKVLTDEDGIEEKEVKIGLRDEMGWTEIVSGLEQTDKVIID